MVMPVNLNGYRHVRIAIPNICNGCLSLIRHGEPRQTMLVLLLLNLTGKYRVLQRYTVH